jgi:hypothetical protein
LGALTGWLHLIQPAARLWGRLRRGLTPWRRRCRSGSGGLSLTLPWRRTLLSWVEQWQPHDQRLHAVERALADCGAVENQGGSFDRWDIEVRGGMLGSSRLRLLVEEHGRGRQLARYRIWPRMSSRAVAPIVLLGLIGVAMALGRAWEPAAMFAGAVVLVCGRALYESAAAMALMRQAIDMADPGVAALRRPRVRQTKTAPAAATPTVETVCVAVPAAKWTASADDDAAMELRLGAS